jgi:hypothetical protein
MNCMAEGARGGIRPVKAIEELMARAPRYDEIDDLSISSVTAISEVIAVKDAV